MKNIQEVSESVCHHSLVMFLALTLRKLAFA
jgi:hypothetical protein